MNKSYSKIYPELAHKHSTKGTDNQKNAQKLRQKLKQITSLTTPIVAIASLQIPNQTLDAAIQVGTPTNTAPISSTLLSIDVDGDGTGDAFLFHLGAPGAQVSILATAPGPHFFQGYTASFGLYTPGKLANNLTYSNNINATTLSTGGNPTSVFLAANPTFGVSGPVGAFYHSTMAQQGYVGMRLHLSSTGLPHMVWMQVEVGAAISNFRLLSFAYEDCPISVVGKNMHVGATTGGVASCSAPTIPTLSEWGLITLAILLMTFGTLYIGKREEILETIGVEQRTRHSWKLGAKWQRPPFNTQIFRKALLATGGLAAIAAILTYLVYGSIATVDIVGTAIAGPLFAYLMHLLWIFDSE